MSCFSRHPYLCHTIPRLPPVSPVGFGHLLPSQRTQLSFWRVFEPEQTGRNDRHMNVNSPQQIMHIMYYLTVRTRIYLPLQSSQRANEACGAILCIMLAASKLTTSWIPISACEIKKKNDIRSNYESHIVHMRTANVMWRILHKRRSEGRGCLVHNCDSQSRHDFDIQAPRNLQEQTFLLI